MVQIEIIGNIGQDARRVDANGSSFVSFSVADNQTVNGNKVTNWYTCNINRDATKLLPYLVKGQGVFVRGVPRYRIVDSSVHHCKIVSIDVFVNELQLVGGSPAKNDENSGQVETKKDDAPPF